MLLARLPVQATAAIRDFGHPSSRRAESGCSRPNGTATGAL
ncbi:MULTISPECIES: hypothetical protein [Rhodomicrobium]|nr:MULTISPECIES: hypothetical protein [Rhodomicrobium]